MRHSRSTVMIILHAAPAEGSNILFIQNR